MKKDQIKVGGLYTARISGKFVTVRVDAIRERLDPRGMGYAQVTVYDVTNLSTGRKTTFRSAAKFRAEVKPQDAARAIVDAKVQEAIETSPIGYHGEEVDPLRPTEAPKEEASEEADPTDVSTAEPVQAEQPAECVEATLVVPVQSVESNTATVAVPTIAPTSFGAKLASRLAAASQTSKPVAGLTPEQEDIIATSREIEAMRGNGQRVFVIGAGAGTGKTFILKQLEQVLAGNGQYTAFNKPLVEESKAKFRRAHCATTHKLAFQAVGRRFAHRLNGPRVRSYEIAARLGIEDYYVPGKPYPLNSPEWVEAATVAGYGDANPPPADFQPHPMKRLKAAWLAGQLTTAIQRFCQSADPEISARHFRHIDGVDEPSEHTNSDKVKAYLLPFAGKAWADLSSETGTLPFAHDVYVKLWQLGTGADRPVIAADYILLDEAQDTAPVMLDILRQQVHALLVLVGDDNQQIYEWRGAVNAMSAFAGAPRRLLSQSFRFGQAVADVANAVLAGLEEPTDLIMRGLPIIPTRVCMVAEPVCYLYRTNAGAVGRLMAAREEGKRGHLIGGSAEVVKFCQGAMDLQAGKSTDHPELGCFSSWAEVQEYSKEDEGQDLRLMVKLIDEFGAEEIRDALRDMPPEDRADLILSTAHRSKGREWASVKLGPDFPTANKLSDADRRLIYVACTRAQEELDITACPTFCGGWDKQGGGEGGEAKWIPGIDIAYTAPMPTAEELEKYRCDIQAKRSMESSSRSAVSARGSEQENTLPTKVQTEEVVAAPKPSTSVASANRNGEFTWANMDGAWCVRGEKEMVGERVTVTRKDGSKSQVKLLSVTRKLGDLWFYSVR